MKSIPIVFCTLLTFLGFSSLHAQVLLIVDASNPNAVTITGTGISPVASTPPSKNGYSYSANEYSYFDGFDLEGLFTSPHADSGSAIFSTLTTGDTSTGLEFTDFAFDNASTPPPATTKFDLSIFFTTEEIITSPLPETFTRGSPAFKKGSSLVANLSGSSFSDIGYGVVLAGNSSRGGPATTPIGVYELIVPEPSTWALLLASLAALLLACRPAFKQS